MALNGWHLGERIVHKKLWADDPRVSQQFHWIDGDLPDEHAKFHTRCLPFLPLTTLDAQGRPWGSILAGRDGKPGFIQNPRYSVLTMEAKVWPGDPLLESLKAVGPVGEMLVAGIGVEYSTRRRNKFAGKMTKWGHDNGTYNLSLIVNETIGNCPKYINVRDLIPHSTSPSIDSQRLQLLPGERLPKSVIDFIHECDTAFVGTTYEAPASEAALYPSHVGMNQRGGRKGFIRVMPSNGRTVVLPDYSGNRMMTSFGNIEATPLASLTFVSFTTGEILYITGTAQNLYDREAQKLMPFQDRLTTIHATGYTYVKDALPVRQRPETTVEYSPYCPPIHYLAEETPQAKLFDESHKTTALLTNVTFHSPSIATFTWEASYPVSVIPGQAAIMGFAPLLGGKKYQHMAPFDPSSVNDDRIRTWTISRTSSPTSFSLTMREKPGGTVTGALFSIARKLGEVKPAILEDSRPLSLSVDLVGITGDFVLPKPKPATQSSQHDIPDDELGVLVRQLSLTPAPRKKALWVAGGIGITPFLAMLRGLGDATGDWDINLVVSTREPDVLMPLISAALPPSNSHSHVRVDVFSNKPIPTFDEGADGTTLQRHTGRVTPSIFAELEWAKAAPEDREAFVCGPEPFEKVVVDALLGLGVEQGTIHREGFAY
ncbi:hypothetical protein BDZ94DRAFT_1239728 [Collybia nuda]|uniref:FAD-binding FR-type domain-containing protein n=1 Tax=Collybia nuda TaxID=64659 RepID=A0A9P6CF80_9AGAR|nr:hypothetical protein BDZ94DRAFT_1239728 [Collybia nuda]